MKLSIENLSFKTANTNILSDISLDVEANSFIGVLGPNGAGKSTLLKCIYGVNTPDKGSVFFENKNLLTMPRKERARKIAVLAQESGSQFDFSVEQVVEMGRYPHKKTLENYSKADKKIVDETLEKLNLTSYRNRFFNTLSGGEKQRVLIARVLAQEADFIILDEPTNHLDIGHQIGIMNIVKNLGVTVLAAIHDINIAALYCDNLVVLKQGQIVTSGTTNHVINKTTIKDTFNIDVDVYQHKTCGKNHIAYNLN
ncbi:ABC transporter ATP-binding protein [Oceanihabitans sp. IOP_32]|uniref:ABC transporter ATP-binding protein n=1 Tax=Oceanihabitans sp. IOP_32 TaxID=2529032 RepID=UPI001292FE88|nr:ABC transporter ATP-binding protein [Oceanihabitans sp. IOP_32]QFZ54748.1 ABC transporter ATP-binding protein [Oceanihabitans sp. IOP_32]